MSEDKDWLGRQLQEMQRKDRPHRTPRVLRNLHAPSTPAGTEVVRGRGGTIVFRTRFGDGRDKSRR